MNPERVWERISNGFRPPVVLTCAGKRFEVPDLESLAVGKALGVVVRSNGWLRTSSAS